jgi:hypothetical protein
MSACSCMCSTNSTWQPTAHSPCRSDTSTAIQMTLYARLWDAYVPKLLFATGALAYVTARPQTGLATEILLVTYLLSCEIGQ